MTLDDAISAWDIENQTDEERADTILAIQRGLDDMHAGRTVDAFESAERLSHKMKAHDGFRGGGRWERLGCHWSYPTSADSPRPTVTGKAGTLVGYDQWHPDRPLVRG